MTESHPGGCPRADDAAAYAAGALEPEERAAFDVHLEACALCRDGLARYLETAEVLAWAADVAPPPPELKQRVLARWRAERAHQPPPPADALPAEAPPSQALPAEAPPAEPLPTAVGGAPRTAAGAPPAVRGVRGRLAMPAWAAAAMIGLALLSGALGWRTRQLSARVELLERTAAGNQVFAVVRTLELAGAPAAPQATGRLLVLSDGRQVRVVLDAAGLPPLRPGQSYQLWLIRDGERENGGTFVVDRSGRGGVARLFPATLRFDSAGITREPDAFGTAPRGERVLASR